ncbi:hypothetical protein CRG98_035084 [Punica granatum]|uniref:Uncharacterized protein n=1 Tax=Punica granatum TaxID=22663 RepID=A0A2I0IME6_PUNGR|nr:hypothetical protein CRG98_035084 [Punica granatum]
MAACHFIIDAGARWQPRIWCSEIYQLSTAAQTLLETSNMVVVAGIEPPLLGGSLLRPSFSSILTFPGRVGQIPGTSEVAGGIRGHRDVDNAVAGQHIVVGCAGTDNITLQGHVSQNESEFE